MVYLSGMNRPAAALSLSTHDRAALTRWAHGVTAPYRVVTCAKGVAAGRRRRGEQSHCDGTRD